MACDSAAWAWCWCWSSARGALAQAPQPHPAARPSPLRRRDDPSPSRSILVASRRSLEGVGPVRRRPRTGGGEVRRPRRTDGVDEVGNCERRDWSHATLRDIRRCPAPVRVGSRTGFLDGRPASVSGLCISVRTRVEGASPGAMGQIRSLCVCAEGGRVARLDRDWPSPRAVGLRDDDVLHERALDSERAIPSGAGCRTLGFPS